MPQALNVSDRQLSVSATEAMRHFEAGDWSNSLRPRSEFIASVALRLVLAGYLIGDVSRSTAADGTETIRVTLDGRPVPAERRRAADALVLPLAAYAEIAQLSVDYNAANETGAVPVPLIIAGTVVNVAIVAAGATVVVMVANKALEIVDGALKRRDASAEIQRADAAYVSLVNAHVQREVQAGKTIPLDAATTRAMSNLETRVSKLVRSSYGRPENGFPTWIFPALGVAAAAVVTAIFVIKKEKKHDRH